MRVHVIGIGTLHADDAIGLAIADRLASLPLPDGVIVKTCARPLPDLLDAFEGADGAVLVDAACTGAAPGSILRFAVSDLARSRTPSSHGVGVAQALALAEALGCAPARVECLAVEAIPVPRDAPWAQISPAVAASICEAADAALEIACKMQRDGKGEACDA